MGEDVKPRGRAREIEALKEIEQQVENLSGIARQNVRIAIAIRSTNAATVSKQAGMSINGLGAWLRGKTSISYINLLSVCLVLKIPIGILHRPGAVTPGRLDLHETLESLPPEEIRLALDQLRGSEAKTP